MILQNCSSQHLICKRSGWKMYYIWKIEYGIPTTIFVITQSLDITLGTIGFLGLWFSIASAHVFITWLFYYLGLMHSCMLKNTTFHECFKIFFSLYFKGNFIRIALHSRMFKNDTFHEWDFFIRYSFHFQIHCIDGSATCFRLANTT